MNNPDNQHTIIRIAGGVARHPLWRMAEPINLEVKQGEQIAIVGDNAAGKTRLVEVLTGHYPLLMNEVQYDFFPSKLNLVSENLKYISFRDSYGEQDGTYYVVARDSGELTVLELDELNSDTVTADMLWEMSGTAI